MLYIIMKVIFLFNWIGEEELIDYLRNRYPKEFNYVEVTTRYIC